MAKKSNTAETGDAEPKAPKVVLVEQNGVTQPREGSKTRRIWNIANEVSTAKNAPALLAEVKDLALAENLNPATIQTQYNRWRTFHGLPPQGRAKSAPAAEPVVAAE